MKQIYEFLYGHERIPNHIYKYYLQNEIIKYYKKKYTNKITNYEESQNIVYNQFTNIILYKEPNKHELLYKWNGKINIEHVWCRKYLKNESYIKNDLHNLFLSDSKENSLRSDKPFKNKINKKNDINNYYIPNFESKIYLFYTLCYFRIYYPHIYMENIDKMIHKKTWKDWYKNYKYSICNSMNKLLYRDVIIEKIQGNSNPFLTNPFLFYILFDENDKMELLQNLQIIIKRNFYKMKISLFHHYFYHF